MKFPPVTVSILIAALAWSLPQSVPAAAPDSVPALRGRPADSTGTVQGRVVLTPHHLGPAAFANVIVVGTRRGAQADEEGRFTIRDVPIGKRVLRIQYPGVPGPPTLEFDIGPGRNELGDLELATHFPPPVAVGSRALVSARDLEATIRPVQKRIRVGDGPEFEVRIRNRGASAVLLASSVDASDRGASPQVRIEIAGPPGGLTTRSIAFCGNNNGVRPEDFTEIGPGEEFDPYTNGWLGLNLRDGRFSKPGRYTATFRYVTTETDPRRWMAGPDMSSTTPASLIDLLERVPAVDLTATTTFDVEL